MQGTAQRVAEAKEKRHALRSGGLCYSCGGSPETGSTRCTACRTKDKSRQASDRSARVASALCTQCKESAVPGQRKCENHRTVQRASSQRHHRRRPPTQKVAAILRNAKQRALAQGREFSITIEDLLPLPDFCSVLGIEILYSFSGKKGPRAASPSVDRIDNSRGYEKGNVRIISARANRLRADASLDELRALVRDAEHLAARNLSRN